MHIQLNEWIDPHMQPPPPRLKQPSPINQDRFPQAAWAGAITMETKPLLENRFALSCLEVFAHNHCHASPAGQGKKLDPDKKTENKTEKVSAACS